MESDPKGIIRATCSYIQTPAGIAWFPDRKTIKQLLDANCIRDREHGANLSTVKFRS